MTSTARAAFSLALVALSTTLTGCFGPYFKPDAFDVKTVGTPKQYRQVVVTSAIRGQSSKTPFLLHDEVARLLNVRGIPAVADPTAQVAGPDQVLLSVISSPVAVYRGPEFWPDFGVQALTCFTYGFIIPRLYPVADGVTYQVGFVVTDKDGAGFQAGQQVHGYHRNFYWLSEGIESHVEQHSQGAFLLAVDAVAERLRPLMRDGTAPATSAAPPVAESAQPVGAQ
jgi:hypothetical protein